MIGCQQGCIPLHHDVVVVVVVAVGVVVNKTSFTLV